MGGKRVALSLSFAGVVLLVLLALLIPSLSFELPDLGVSWGATPLAADSANSALGVGTVTAARVTKVSDGDTIHVEFDDGTSEKVRLIGIDTPESTNQVEPWGVQATQFTVRAVPVGTRVWVETDAELRDRYGRLLAYIWLKQPTSQAGGYVRDHMLNAMIASAGYAQPLTIQPNSKYAEILARFVAEARSAERGMWSADAPANP